MFKVKNTNAIKNIATKSYKSNKKRSIMAIFAIILTTVLFTTLFTVGMGVKKSMEYNSMRMSGGMAHASFKYLSDEQVDIISKNEMFEKVGTSKMCGFLSDEKLIKRKVELNCKNEIDMEMQFIKLSGGELPTSDNDLILDTTALQMLGLECKAGQTIVLETDFSDRTEKISFNICGWYENDPAVSASIGLVSQKFADKHLSGRGQNYNKDLDYEGSCNLNVMFANSLNIEKNIETIIEECGFSNDITSKDYITYGVNWAYMSTSTDDSFSTIVAIIAVLILIMFTGYLIIYNIFQISVIKDIRFYGLLKTIGTTGKQIRQILIRQAMRMCVVGVPFGIIIGFGIGAVILPVVTAQMDGGLSYVSYNPIIFIGSAIFAILTVLISCNKPAKTASKISPIEAVKFSGVDKYSRKKVKKSTDGAKAL